MQSNPQEQHLSFEEDAALAKLSAASIVRELQDIADEGEASGSTWDQTAAEIGAYIEDLIQQAEIGARAQQAQTIALLTHQLADSRWRRIASGYEELLARVLNKIDESAYDEEIEAIGREKDSYDYYFDRLENQRPHIELSLLPFPGNPGKVIDADDKTFQREEL